MKAKDLAKLLMQHPEAEVVIDEYAGLHYTVDVNVAVLHTKGTHLPDFHNSGTNAVQNNGKCKVDVVYLGRTN